MAIVDSAGKSYKTDTKPDMGELASAGFNLYGQKDIIPYNPDTLIGRKGFYV